MTNPSLAWQSFALFSTSDLDSEFRNPHSELRNPKDCLLRILRLFAAR
jgi:hypothetical protein